MSSSWGGPIRISVFGESHGEAIGVVLDNLPAGEPIDPQEIMVQMERRAPGRSRSSTPRREEDLPQVVSGLLHGKTTGTPLCALIRNKDTHSSDYDKIKSLPRPGHADYTGFVRYGGSADPRGGGHFSGRLTAPLTFAGAVCRQILSARGIEIGAHIASVADVQDERFCPEEIPKELLLRLSRDPFALIDRKKEGPMLEKIEAARLARDSVGGTVECAAAGVPAGLGSPMFYGVENVLSSILFGIPAVKGVEFGNGFGAAARKGSENNDAFRMEDGQVKTATNRCGGILGGITTGMPLLLRAAFKPTPSISQEQDTVNLESMENAKLIIQGRHDPCIVPRAVPVVEAAAAVGLLNLMAERGKL